jgi:small subunit ribosomal protein S2
MATITMKQLLESGIHFGHQTRRWNPKMARYIFGERHGIYIIDLQKTMRQLGRAYKTVRDATAKGGTVLFVGTKKQAREAVREQAERSGQYFMNNRWLGGTLTNWETIQKSLGKLHQIEELESSGKINQYKKKEASNIRKHREKLEKNFSGIKELERLPSVLFIIDSQREAIAVREAKRLGIPCIGICDTNADPDTVDIPIPGNDDAIRAITLFCSLIADAAIEGKAIHDKEAAEQRQRSEAAAAEAARSAKLARQQLKSRDEQPASAEAPAETEAAEAAEATPEAAETEAEA